jgi:hypothetical protein
LAAISPKIFIVYPALSTICDPQMRAGAADKALPGLQRRNASFLKAIPVLLNFDFYSSANVGLLVQNRLKRRLWGRTQPITSCRPNGRIWRIPTRTAEWLKMALMLAIHESAVKWPSRLDEGHFRGYTSAWLELHRPDEL